MKDEKIKTLAADHLDVESDKIKDMRRSGDDVFLLIDFGTRGLRREKLSEKGLATLKPKRTRKTKAAKPAQEPETAE